jgi:hypothetical protein
MKTNKLNMLLTFFLIVLIFTVFSVYYNESFESNEKKLIEQKKQNTNTNTNTNTNIEKFHINNSGYHGNFPPDFPFTVSHVPQVPSQNRQILNNMRFQQQSIYDDPYQYPNISMQPTVIGCGGRNVPCMGGSQIPIPNTMTPINISGQNIAPINLTVRGFDEGVQQVGTIQKVFGKENFVYPLFGRKRFRNDSKWEYFVKFGDYGVILPLIPLRNYEELNNNDQVYIQGQKGEYRVTMYDDDIPQYLPFV